MLWKGGYTMQLFVLGGDSRIGFMAEALCREGFRVAGLGISAESIPVRALDEGAGEADAVILGVPASRDGKTVFAPFYNGLLPLESLLAVCSPGKPVLCGMASAVMQKSFAAAGVPLIDYFSREELALLNAVPTAEGAIEIAMREMPITLWGANCLVAGFGRIGKYLAHVLSALGAHVTVSARKAQDFALCRMLGYAAVRTDAITRTAKTYDIVFNTVPEKVINASVLSALKPGALVIDLASLPGGVDTEAARAFEVKTIHALSLPSKVAPVSAGEILCDTVRNILSERNL